jgi:hypothetical protein
LARRCAFVDAELVGRPRAVRVLFADEPVDGAGNQVGVNIVDFAHVGEFQQTVSRQDFVGGLTVRRLLNGKSPLKTLTSFGRQTQADMSVKALTK